MFIHTITDESKIPMPANDKCVEFASNFAKELLTNFDPEQTFEVLMHVRGYIKRELENKICRIGEDIEVAQKRHAVFSDLLKKLG